MVVTVRVGEAIQEAVEGRARTRPMVPGDRHTRAPPAAPYHPIRYAVAVNVGAALETWRATGSPGRTLVRSAHPSRSAGAPGRTIRQCGSRVSSGGAQGFAEAGAPETTDGGAAGVAGVVTPDPGRELPGTPGRAGGAALHPATRRPRSSATGGHRRLIPQG
ncbi:hypothetical protein [Nostocoides sp. HKS02]|uniref:hypothetical protein n=1 Tax=Nostocoides sp. HKS02 TaxID=1813880 RepID=UPI0012B45F49|nr:hypothetical protein [Tetrasphaera sp. HKS02]QGN59110.1 hypothetical protein GKE56_15815 [Tetrasphaera sp. HKS02]